MDQALLQALQRGERRAREQLWSELVMRLADYFLVRVHHDCDVAMELSQSTAADLLKKLVIEEIETVEELLSRAYGFADKQLKRHHEKQRRERKHDVKLAAHRVELELLDCSSLESDYGDGELRALLDHLLERLPPNLQLFWELRTRGYSYAKIAEVVEVSETTAQRRVEAAKRRLQREYERARRTRPEFRSPPGIAS